MSGQPNGFADKVAFIWGVADLLRGDFKAHEYGQVVLPFTVLRRLECALAPTKAAVIDRALTLAGKVDNVDRILRHAAAGHAFYNVSPLDLSRLLNDPDRVAPNLRTYLAGFSPSAREVLEAYGFEDKIVRLDKAGLLYQVVAKFAELDLTEAVVGNDAMGYIFEELLRRFSEMSNETAGEHFTPREVIKLMVGILFAEDDAALTGAKPVRTLYDGACGTGGMLSGAQDHLRELNPDALLQVYGQEINAETWAVCRSDLMLKGQDPERIVLGNSLTHEDGHAGLKVDYALANPPFGVDWKKYAPAVAAERDAGRRYAPGLPRVSDGSLLFLMHMLSKMKPVTGSAGAGTEAGGTRLAIVFSGSPLFAGAAGGNESEIRRWILENDWLEGIVALPDQLFYNTGISTYFWVLTNRKPPERRGKVVLVDARASWTKMRKSLGDKRKYLSPEQINDVTRLYADALGHVGVDKRVKVFDREAFGYQRITVERPLRRHWELTADAVDALVHEKAWAGWLVPPKGHTDGAGWVHSVELAEDTLLGALHGLVGDVETTEAGFRKRLTQAYAAAGMSVPDKVAKAVLGAAAVPDPEAPVITDRKGQSLPDTDLRDNENIALPAGWIDLTDTQREKALREQAERHLTDEIRPYAPDAWIDHTKTKIGYEIPFTRHFYEYVSPRPLADIDADLAEIEQRIQELLGGLAQ